jgi:hypothetical protein
MFLVAGLGNPGEEYAGTPHNLGFMVVDRLAEMHAIRVTRHDSKALTGVGQIAGREVMLAKPQTFMNLSGTSLKPLMEKHFAHGGGSDSGLRRIGPAVGQFADQAARIVRRPQRSGLHDPQSGYTGICTGAFGDSSRPSA